MSLNFKSIYHSSVWSNCQDAGFVVANADIEMGKSFDVTTSAGFLQLGELCIHLVPRFNETYMDYISSCTQDSKDILILWSFLDSDLFSHKYIVY